MEYQSKYQSLLSNPFQSTSTFYGLRSNGNIQNGSFLSNISLFKEMLRGILYHTSCISPRMGRQNITLPLRNFRIRHILGSVHHAVLLKPPPPLKISTGLSVVVGRFGTVAYNTRICNHVPIITHSFGN